MSRRIAVVGSLNVDRMLRVPRLPAPGETTAATGRSLSPGGKGANQAVAAALLGADVSLIGAVGDDAEGRFLVDAVATQGVDASGVMTVPDPTGEATILVDDGAENLIVVNGGANLALDPEHVRSRLSGFDIIVAGFEVSDPVVEAAAEAALRQDAVFILNPSPYRDLPAIVREARLVLIVNEQEYAQARDAEGTLSDSAIIVVTRGARGAAIQRPSGGRPQKVPAPRVTAVDTSGCGDAFAGALAAALAHGDSLEDAVRLGTRVGAYAATRPGTQTSYPTGEDLSVPAAG
ncbi:ribokinase [Microbacterium sp. USTB-Y]|uniref:ribokinase n=1 Tax=Microbacterium sp. USTB-Y TaxID=2823692 RepID=UPI00203BC947|nr:ribokinase [Microbacterium sp. USTB-Y]